MYYYGIYFLHFYMYCLFEWNMFFLGAQLLVFISIRVDLSCERVSLLNPLGIISHAPAGDSLSQRRCSLDPPAVPVRPHIPTAYSTPDGWANSAADTSGLGRCMFRCIRPFFSNRTICYYATLQLESCNLTTYTTVQKFGAGSPFFINSYYLFSKDT